MIIDLLDYPVSEPVCVDCDLCIIGGGTAGLYLASLFAKTSLNISIIECGSDQHVTPDNDLHSTYFPSSNYLGVEKGRSFGLGGTSRLWGGQMIPLAESDFQNRQYLGFPKWPISFSEISRYFPSVYSLLGISSSVANQQYFSDLLNHNPLNNLGELFTLRYSSWIPFKLRNFATTFRSTISTSDNIKLWTNSHYVSASIENHLSSNTVSAITCQSLQGHSMSVSSKYFVFCCGAIESTRYIMDLNNSLSQDLNQAGCVGHYFQDHLSSPVASIDCLNLHEYTRYISPKFIGGTLHTPRVDTSSLFQSNSSITSSFVHFLFDIPVGSGVDLVKNFLRSKQGSSEFSFSSSSYFGAAKDILGLASNRVFNNSLYIPKNSSLTLQVDIEQFPSYDNYISLDYHKLDSLGRPTISLDWSISERDYDVISTVKSHFISAWNLSPALSKLATLRPFESNDIASIYDVYHPTGSLRMGSSPSGSSVDPKLRLWNFGNVYVSSTAVLPSPGSANPGLTHLSLTHRLYDHLLQICYS